MEIPDYNTQSRTGITNLISEALSTPISAISYNVSGFLAALFPAKAIVEGNDESFSLQTYAAAGHCTLSPKPLIHSQIVTQCYGSKRLWRYPTNAWFEVSWQSEELDVLLMSWQQGSCETRNYWILANSHEIAEKFLLTVCEWCTEVRGEVLVFERGDWYKDEELFESITKTTFDNLILQGSLKQKIAEDLKQFFASKELYERYGIPWKRGILFIGSPGNGKTHAVKALINATERPCLYVKSFKAYYGTDHDSIREVFRRARQVTPCILVMEDLDSLINDGNRSFFLNEIDGFAANTGIVTLATTNHPERLDSAILERPSRFDRKYHFDLPAMSERIHYITLWNKSLQPELRLSEAGITQVAEVTAEFSFAYIKELFLSSIMQWIGKSESETMETVMVAQAATLREQMSSMNMNEKPTPETEPDESDNPL